MARKYEEIGEAKGLNVTRAASRSRRAVSTSPTQGQNSNVATHAPVSPTRKRRKGGVLTESDPLFSLIGIGRSGVPGGFSSRKYDALLGGKRTRSAK